MRRHGGGRGGVWSFAGMLVVLMVFGRGARGGEDSLAVGEEPPFERTARLVFKAHCFHCHGEAGVVKGGLDLRLRRLIIQGGDSGSAVTPFDTSDSYLLDRMVEGDMPPEEVAIRPTAAEVEVVRKWVEGGAKTARVEPENPEDLPRITEEDRGYWAFRPVERPAVPVLADDEARGRLRTPIDAFVLKELMEQNRGFAPEAGKVALIRRGTFDLTGLPPTPEEVEAFVSDEAPDAWERLLDRLLDSPRYGERWGRHWLDVVGYADSEGFTENDKDRPHAYKYRDYVVAALNEDLPFDRFLVEQLAGDELVESPMEELTAADRRKLEATGFLRMAPDGTGSGPDDPVLARNAVVTETVNIVSTALLGMTVGCAQCHDHRFDPILQDDFYRLRGVFEPVLNPAKWKTPEERRIPLVKPEDRARTEEVQAKVEEAQKVYDAREAECIEMVFQRELKKVPEELRELGEAAFHTPARERTDEQKQVLTDYPNLKVGGGSALDLYLELFEEGRKAKKELEELKAEVSKRRGELPKTDYIRGVTEPVGELPETHVFERGDPAQPGKRVGPGSLTVLGHLLPVDLPEKDEGPRRASSGRRLAFARHLVDPRNPLPARVLVNRFWLHHFGRGLVETPGDFGSQGEKPTHPELLDWLAREFIDSGWQLKRFHKMVMMSTVYRQSSRRVEEGFDPENRYYARQSVRRLEAETIRDAILFVSGGLSNAGPGPALRVKQTEEGQTVVEADMAAKGGSSRRSLYVEAKRSTPLAMLEVFDAPRPEPNCTMRTVSTVTPQSLLLMNSQVLVEQSKAFARRVISEVGEDVEAQAVRAWKIAYGEAPGDEELCAGVEFLRAQTAEFEGRAAKTEKDKKETLGASEQALGSFCMVLMGSNRFLYVD